MTIESARPQGSAPPRIVVLREGRAGDDRQLVNLAEALGRPYEVVPFRVSVGRVIRDRILDALHLSGPPRGRACWGPPWPDLVLASGGRAVSTAIRLRRVSGGRTRVVFVGRPWARLDRFDLVVTTPQYGLPERDNVIRNLLPLNRLNPDAIDDARHRWADRLCALPRPHIAVLLGGNSSSYRLDAETARRIATRASARANALGGTLLVTSSPRTPKAALEAFAAAMTAPGELYRWSPDDPDNPLTAYVASADRLMVTGESASMLAEAFRTGKPVEVLPLRKRRRARLLTGAPDGAGAPVATLLATLVRRIAERGLVTPPRDLTRLHDALEAATVVATSDGAARCLTQDEDMGRAVAAIEALLAQHGQTAYKTTARGVALAARPTMPNEQSG